MSRRLVILLVTFFILALTGCGSNDKRDASDIKAQQKVYLEPAPIETNPSSNEFSLHIPVKNNWDQSYKVKINKLSLHVTNCNIGILSLPDQPFEIKTSSTHLDISGTFTNTCKPSSYTLEYQEIISKDGKEITANRVFDSTNRSQRGYRFLNTNSPLVITTPSKHYSLKLQLVKDDYPAPQKRVKIKAFDATFGELDNYSAETDAKGYAIFDYTAPEVLPGNGIQISLSVNFEEDGGSNTLKSTFILRFDSQGSSVGNVNTSRPIVVIPTDIREVTLTKNSQVKNFTIKVFKEASPYGKGTVKVELPGEVLDGVDIGSFSKYEVPVSPTGEATFTYTGPNNLKVLTQENHKSTFKFYHSENTSPENRQPMTITYALSSDYIPINYRIAITTQDDKFSIGIPDKKKLFNLELQKLDGSTLKSDEANITKVTIQTENGAVGQLYDEGSKKMVDRLSLSTDNGFSYTFVIKTKKFSGLIPLRVTINFIDANGNKKDLEKIVNVRVTSGPPSAISISYVSTDQDKEKAKYIERFAISVTDEYGNNVNTKPNITLGAIAGYAVDGREASGQETNETKRLIYTIKDIQEENANGKIDPLDDKNPNKTIFQELIQTDPFKYVNKEGNNTDKLVVFGKGKNYEAMGKWDFSKRDNSSLNLTDGYYGSSRSGLSYAIGRNYYQDQCEEDGREWIGTTSAPSYQLDDEGTVVIEYKYDYHLTGKDVMVWVNLDGYQPDTGKKTKIGEVLKHTLRGTGLIKIPSKGYQLEKGKSARVYFGIWHKNAPEKYRNAHFSFDFKVGNSCFWQVVNTSNFYDARTCSNGFSNKGISYIVFDLLAPATKACTFDIDRILVSPEF